MTEHLVEPKRFPSVFAPTELFPCNLALSEHSIDLRGRVGAGFPRRGYKKMLHESEGVPGAPNDPKLSDSRPEAGCCEHGGARRRRGLCRGVRGGRTARD